ncbi:MAG: YfcC family protein [Synergistes sp.]|nr:YfcC family protein [Synergistes sp.]
MTEKKPRIKMPHVFVLLMLIITICGLLSYVVPAGQYQRVHLNPADETSRMVIDPASFKYVAQTPVNLMTALSSLAGGMSQAADIIFFIFIVGGSIAVLQKSGALEGALRRLAKGMAGREIATVPVIMLLIVAMTVIMGACEEFIPVIPIMVALAIRIGFDSITGAAMVICSTSAGFACSILNPFNIGVAQSISELPPYSGWQFRLVMLAVIFGITIFLVCQYALKVKKDPQLSPMYEFDRTREEITDEEREVPFGTREKLVITVFIATIVILVIGVLRFEWYLSEIGALFLGMSIIIGIAAKMGLDGYGQALADGMADICSGALVVGFATGILYILNQGNILDTILHGAAALLQGLPSQVSAVGMYVFQCLMNYLIPSGSGQAAVTMPILSPLSDLVGVTRQTAVIAFQLGDGISNAITPTSGVLMASLALAKIPWTKWAKWFLPVMLIQYAVGLAFVVAAQSVGLGPF